MRRTHSRPSRSSPLAALDDGFAGAAVNQTSPAHDSSSSSSSSSHRKASLEQPALLSKDHSAGKAVPKAERQQELPSQEEEEAPAVVPQEVQEDVEEEEEEEEEEEDEDVIEKSTIPPQLMEKLSRFSLFKNAPISFRRAIAGRLRLMQHHSQEYIVKFGEPAKAMYWILRGSVAVTSPDGEAVHAELVAGQFFGEIGILFNRPRTATVIARTKVLLAVLTVDNFNAVLPDFPAVERMIRDEAQERLSMQDKRKRNGVTNIIPSSNIALRSSGKDSIGTTASNIANAVSTLPGPSIPPRFDDTHEFVYRGPAAPILRLGSLSQALLLDNSRFGLPQIHDNVDHSIPTRDFLRSLPMFTLLPSAIIHELVLGVEPKRFESFEYIVRKGETGRDIFFIVNGEVEVLHPKRISLAYSEGDRDKKVDRVIARLGTGQYFGEMAFLQSLSEDKDEIKIERSADIRSITTVDVLVVSGDQLENLYSRYPRICDEMKETAMKRLNRNKDTEEVDVKDDSFENWNGFNTSRRSSLIRPMRPLSPPLPPPPSSSDVGPTDMKIKRSTSPLSTLSDQSSIFSHVSNNRSIFKESTSSSSGPHEEPFKHPLPRKRSISAISPAGSSKIANQPLNLNMPPMNPVLPSMNSFPSQQRQQQPFQYINHAKRLRMASISGGRRRSSILSTNTIPDRLLLKVFQFLSLPELMKLRIICRRWRQLLYVAPGFFETLDLRPYNTSIDDKALTQITDFVGSRPKIIDISDCFHVTDVGFCYMINEIGMSGEIKIVKMRSVWDVSAMAIMDLAVPSIGHHIEELDLSNCRKVRDDVIERIIGWKKKDKILQSSQQQHRHHHLQSQQKGGGYTSLDEPIPGMEEFDEEIVEHGANPVGCSNLKKLTLGYCKHLTDRSMYHIALHASERLEYLDITRCTTITDAGFAFWSYQPFPNLRHLKLCDCTFLTDKSIVAIASSAQLLETLDLSFCCALTDVSIEVLCLGCPCLKHLDLSFCGSAVSDSTLLAISIHLRNLESLVIKGCVRVTRAGVDALLSSSIPLKYLDISQCRNAHTYKNSNPAAEIKPRPGSKSAFVTTTHDKVVQIVI